MRRAGASPRGRFCPQRPPLPQGPCSPGGGPLAPQPGGCPPAPPHPPTRAAPPAGPLPSDRPPPSDGPPPRNRARAPCEATAPKPALCRQNEAPPGGWGLPAEGAAAARRAVPRNRRFAAGQGRRRGAALWPSFRVETIATPIGHRGRFYERRGSVALGGLPREGLSQQPCGGGGGACARRGSVLGHRGPFFFFGSLNLSHAS